MTGVHIRVRTTKAGKRYQVRYRRGGRGFALVSAGTFKTKRDAMVRHDLVAGWLAAAKDPKVELAKATAPTVEARPFREWATAYLNSRVDLAPKSRSAAGTSLRRVNATFGDRDPHTFTAGDVRAFVGELAATMTPGSIRQYMSAFAQVLDFADVDPNPVRDKRVKLPAKVKSEPVPPSADHVLAILENVRRPLRLPLVVMEQTGMRGGELESLCWADVDIEGSRFLLRAAKTKTSRARWVQVPGWLMKLIVAGTPPDSRDADRRVFAGFVTAAVRKAMARACANAGIPHYHPHDFRHRRISLWHGQGIPARELADRVGHARVSESLDVYSHVLIDSTEIPVERFRSVLA